MAKGNESSMAKSTPERPRVMFDGREESSMAKGNESSMAKGNESSMAKSTPERPRVMFDGREESLMPQRPLAGSGKSSLAYTNLGVFQLNWGGAGLLSLVDRTVVHGLKHIARHEVTTKKHLHPLTPLVLSKCIWMTVDDPRITFFCGDDKM